MPQTPMTLSSCASIAYQDQSQPSFLPQLLPNTVSYAYDDFGNRIKKAISAQGGSALGGSNTYYINNGLSVLNELDSAGAVTKFIIQGIGQIAEIDATGAITFVHQDVLGSTVLLTDNVGAVVAEYEYDLFGEVIGGYTYGADTNYLFTNQEYDPESDLYYYNARYYNSNIGRFISRDAVLGRDGDMLSWNRYAYVKNNPLKWVDPTGEKLSSVLDYLPLTGDISDVFALYTGQTLFGESRLTQKEVEGIGAFAMIPFLTAGQGRLVGKAEQRLEGAMGRAGIRSISKAAPFVNKTVHGADQLLKRGFTDKEILLTEATNIIKIQMDGAKVYVKEIKNGKFNVIVEGERGIITGLKNISQKALDRLSKNYNWK